MMGSLVGWVPLLDPIDAHDAWFLFLVPLSFGIAVAYKAVRSRRLDRFWGQVGVMTAQIVGAMVLLWIVSYVVVQVVVPMVAPPGS